MVCFASASGFASVQDSERRVTRLSAKRKNPPASKRARGFGASPPPSPQQQDGANEQQQQSEESATPRLFGTELPPDFEPRGYTMRNEFTKQGYLKPQYGPESTLPEIVSQRMLRRAVVLFGVPFFTGITGFVVFYVLSVKYDVVFLPAVVGSSTLGVFALSLAGLTYGIMSASWDVEKEGSLLGVKEFRMNMVRALEGVGRQRMQEKAEDTDDK